jgi:TetR/AcrR family transcriptional regulator, regulator of autoinduction and epiphytic fitness
VNDTLDGRVQRGVRSRAAVVDAVLDLLGDGVARPTAEQVAARSGVSMRTIFRLFDDMGSLHRAAAARQFERLAALLVEPGDAGALGERIDALVANRADVYEAVTPVRRAANRLAVTSPEIAAELARVAGLLRAQAAGTFRDELAGAGPGVLDAVDLLTSWESWERLRAGQGLTAEQASMTLRHALAVLLGS